jgi:hypothetical protein
MCDGVSCSEAVKTGLCELQVISFHNAKASTSVRLSTVLVEIGKWTLVFGSRAQVSISSPAKSTGWRMIELKKNHLVEDDRVEEVATTTIA